MEPYDIDSIVISPMYCSMDLFSCLLLVVSPVRVPFFELHKKCPAFRIEASAQSAESQSKALLPVFVKPVLLINNLLCWGCLCIFYHNESGLSSPHLVTIGRPQVRICLISNL